MASKTRMNQEERSERSRTQILRAALTLFSSQGYRATSMRDIARAARVSTRSTVATSRRSHQDGKQQRRARRAGGEAEWDTEQQRRAETAGAPGGSIENPHVDADDPQHREAEEKQDCGKHEIRVRHVWRNNPQDRKAEQAE